MGTFILQLKECSIQVSFICSDSFCSNYLMSLMASYVTMLVTQVNGNIKLLIYFLFNGLPFVLITTMIKIRKKYWCLATFKICLVFLRVKLVIYSLPLGLSTQHVFIMIQIYIFLYYLWIWRDEVVASNMVHSWWGARFT